MSENPLTDGLLGDSTLTDGPVGDTPATHASGPRRRRGVRMRTVVFGLMLLAVAVTLTWATLANAVVDAASVAIALVIGAGVLLVAGGVAAAVREAQER